MPRAARLTIAIGVAVIAFAAFLWFLIARTGAAKEYVAGKIASGFREQGLILQNRNIGIALFGPGITLNDVVISTEAAPDLPPILKAESIRASLSMSELLRGGYALKEVVIKNPQIDAVVTQQGRSNLPAARGGGNQQMRIPNLRVTGGSLRLDNRRDRIFASLPKWDLSLHTRPDATLAGVKFETGAPGSVSKDNRKTVLNEINLESLARSNGAEIRKLQLTTQAGRINATGSADLAGAPTLNLRGDVALSLPQLTALAGMPRAASGEVKGPFTAVGPLNRLRIQADLRGDRIPVWGFERPVIRTDATYQREQQRIQVRSLAVNATAADFTANGSLALRQAEPSSLAANVSRVNLLQVTLNLASPYVLASRGTGTLKANWPGMAFKQANGRADLQLTALLPAPTRKVLPASGPVSVVSQGRQMQLSSNALSALSTQWNGNVTLAPGGGLGGIVHGRTADAGRLLSEVNALLGRRQPLVPVNVNGAANFDVNLSGTVRQPVAQLAVQAPSLRVGRFENAALTARALYTPAQLHIQQSELRWMGQTLNLQGNVGLQGGVGALDLNARAQGAAAGALLGGAGTPAIPGNLPAIPGLPQIPGLSQIPGMSQASGMPQVAVQAHIGGTTAQPKVTLRGAAPAAAGE